MTKNLFQPGEIKRKDGEFQLGLVHNFYEPVEEVEVEEVPQFVGPTAEDLHREAEEFKKRWEVEKQQMKDDAQAEAEAIINNAKDTAFAEVKRQSDEAQVIKADAEEKAQENVPISLGDFVSQSVPAVRELFKPWIAHNAES